jgi:hypothetical protein
MDLGLLKALREEWPLLKTAPWSFGTVFFIASAIGFGVASLWWSGTVSTLRERLAFAQDKLQVALANPANPAALITKPNDQGRHLSEKEKQCLFTKLKDENKNFIALIITAFQDNDEAQTYAKEFLGVFIRMGYQSGILSGMPKSYDDTGLIVGLKDPDNPSDIAKKFKDIIGSCVLLNDRKLTWESPPGLLPKLSTVDFNLFVGPKD